MVKELRIAKKLKIIKFYILQFMNNKSTSTFPLPLLPLKHFELHEGKQYNQNQICSGSLKTPFIFKIKKKSIFCARDVFACPPFTSEFLVKFYPIFMSDKVLRVQY